ncbi:MAG TPA: hypothetical protein VKZ45_06320 [Vicingaceae bacterium]|nr:hypothetical protein [Vicingaceae bacterium]
MIIKRRKYIFIALIGFLFFWGCEEFFRRKVGGFAGSYPFVEYWDIKATESEVIKAIVDLKKEKPNLQPPNQNEYFFPRKVEYDLESPELKENAMAYLTDSIPFPPMTKSNTKSDYWLFIDFYYADSKEIVHTWTRPDFDTTITTFAFVSLSNLNNRNDYRLINRDFWYLENKKQIWKFERTFVNEIKEKIEENRKAAHNPHRCR